MATPSSIGSPAMLVLRSTGHSGSEWLASLLASAKVTTFFQFFGNCHRDGEPIEDGVAIQEQLELFRTGCSCQQTSSPAHLYSSDEMMQNFKENSTEIRGKSLFECNAAPLKHKVITGVFCNSK
jgi:hypothetical protein